MIVDTSGSMSIKDKFEPPEQVDVTWHMKFFDQDLRTIAFRVTAEEMPAIAKEVTAARTAEKCILALLLAFFLIQAAFQILHRKNDEKSAKIKDFGLPKPFQNPPKIRRTALQCPGVSKQYALLYLI